MRSNFSDGLEASALIEDEDTFVPRASEEPAESRRWSRTFWVTVTVSLGLVGMKTGTAREVSSKSSLRSAVSFAAVATDAEEAEPSTTDEADRCAAYDEQCSDFGCCEMPGTRCFEKNENYSRCMTACDPTTMMRSDPDEEPWSCQTIGLPNLLTTCSWAGEECGDTHCCNNNGYVCASKDGASARCVVTVDRDAFKGEDIPIDDLGKIIGGSRLERQVLPVQPHLPIAGTSLFCLMVYLPNTTEVDLIDLSRQQGIGVFGCNASLMVPVPAGQEQTVEDRSLAMKSGTPIINTDVFVRAWRRVQEDGRYANHDWVVKSDPDALFFPSRVRKHLEDLRPPAHTAIYIKNNALGDAMGNRGFLGAIEVMSKLALETFLANAEGCISTLGTRAGEDLFMQKCFEAIDVGFMLDSDILSQDTNPAGCSAQEHVAFHSFRDVAQWQCCADVANGVERTLTSGYCSE